MALVDTTWYIGSVHYAAVTVRPQNAAVAAGVVRRQFTAPAVNSERCFVCIIAGTTANTTDATWTLTRGAKSTDGTATWMECTGQSAVNGDLTNTATWAQVKASSGANAVLGQIIKRSSGASYQICTTAGVMSASEPAFSDTAGVTTTDTTAVWTSLGVVGNFSAWGAPHARLANAYAANWGAAGHKFYLADNHAETQAAALTLSSPATLAGGPTYVICVDRTVALPPVEANYKTGATLSTTGSNAITIQIAGFVVGASYYQGLSFVAGDSSNNASISFANQAAYFSMKNCAFTLGGANSSALISVGSSSSGANQVLWDNCTVQFAHVGQSLRLNDVNFEWRNTPSAIQGATFPTALFSPFAQFSGVMVCRGVDFSAYSGQLVISSLTTSMPLVFEDCKFHASMTRYGTSATSGYATSPVITVRCDSGATNYKATRDEYSGAQSTDTSITRVGGATDGTTPSSIKIVTNAQAALLTPYRMLRLAQWNDVTAANRTVTVCGTINSASLPLNDEIWMECQYLGDAVSPKASFKSTCKSHPLVTGAAVASDSSTWNGVGAASTAWNPADISGVATFSNANLTLTASGTGAVRGVGSLSSGKYYWEYTYVFVNTNSLTPGIALASANLAGLGAGVALVQRASGQITINSVNVGTPLGAIPTGGILGVAVDFTSQLIWFRIAPSGNWNGSGTANPATGTGGLSISSISGSLYPVTGFGGGDIVTANFGGSAFTGSVPSGFTAGFIAASTWSPFKLVATLTSPQPQMKGYVYVSVRAAKASATYYIDPLITLS